MNNSKHNTLRSLADVNLGPVRERISVVGDAIRLVHEMRLAADRAQAARFAPDLVDRSASEMLQEVQTLAAQRLTARARQDVETARFAQPDGDHTADVVPLFGRQPVIQVNGPEADAA